MPITYLDVPKGIRIEEKNKLVKAICAVATKEQSKMSMPDNEETLNGRPVIATGCSRGLGRSIFEALLARGADVTVVCAR